MPEEGLIHLARWPPRETTLIREMSTPGLKPCSGTRCASLRFLTSAVMRPTRTSSWWTLVSSKDAMLFTKSSGATTSDSLKVSVATTSSSCWGQCSDRTGQDSSYRACPPRKWSATKMSSLLWNVDTSSRDSGGKSPVTTTFCSRGRWASSSDHKQMFQELPLISKRSSTEWRASSWIPITCYSNTSKHLVSMGTSLKKIRTARRGHWRTPRLVSSPTFLRKYCSTTSSWRRKSRHWFKAGATQLSRTALLCTYLANMSREIITSSQITTTLSRWSLEEAVGTWSKSLQGWTTPSLTRIQRSCTGPKQNA